LQELEGLSAFGSVNIPGAAVSLLSNNNYQEANMRISTTIQVCAFILLAVSANVRAEVTSMDEADRQIDKITEQIDRDNKNAALYLQRGELYFEMNEFEDAIEDFSMAIKLDGSIDAAWYGRGMANGRNGFISEGIADLSVYIERNPDDSTALTKRGVRYLWIGDRLNAKRDLQNAIKINPDNAEAHDDLGVVLSQMGDYKQAIEHFTKTVSIDPSYQKGHHNLALALYITENDLMALLSVDRSLALKPDARNSVLLKSKILTAMGRHDEAKQLEDEAIFLPEANWSETAPIN